MPIHVLPDDIVNKIAAGEVIERPSSVVKELLENSIDAGARTIAVEIAGGGTRAIRVADDGCGIGRDELALALRRHATSKIGSYEDVLGIASYGFRGEALPSIAAVSRLSITSRTAGSATAWSIQCQDGRCGEPRAAAANAGTSIAVEELFAAVP
ncbi:DNA mismatch repair protein MutL, partial [bacterium]|nr:DNA mismatch repair protein MutL [bacterium]